MKFFANAAAALFRGSVPLTSLSIARLPHSSCPGDAESLRMGPAAHFPQGGGGDEMAKIPKYVRKLVGDDVPLEDEHAVADALTRRLQPSPTTVKADNRRSMRKPSGGGFGQRRRFCVSALGGRHRLSWCSWRSQGVSSFAGRKASARSARSCGLPARTTACSRAGPASGGRTFSS